MRKDKEVKMPKREELLYVGIDEPVTLRRTLLESSKSVVHLLRQQQSLKQLRTSRQRMTEELRGLVAHINELTAHAKQLMPQMEGLKLPEEEEEIKPKTAKASKAGKASVAVAQPKMPVPKISAPISAPAIHVQSHVNRLERELQDIENKLKSL